MNEKKQRKTRSHQSQLLDDGKDDNNNDDDDDDNVNSFVAVATVIALAAITPSIPGCYIQRTLLLCRPCRRERFESHCLVHRINAEPMRLSFTVHPADSIAGSVCRRKPEPGVQAGAATLADRPSGWPFSDLIAVSERRLMPPVKQSAVSARDDVNRLPAETNLSAVRSAAIDRDTMRMKAGFHYAYVTMAPSKNSETLSPFNA